MASGLSGWYWKCFWIYFFTSLGVVGWGKGVVYLDHWAVQLILAYSWARPAILAVGKGRGGMFLFLLFHHTHSFSSFCPVPLFRLLYYLFPPFLWETNKMTHKDWHVVEPQHKSLLLCTTGSIENCLSLFFVGNWSQYNMFYCLCLFFFG